MVFNISCVWVVSSMSQFDGVLFCIVLYCCAAVLAWCCFVACYLSLCSTDACCIHQAVFFHVLFCHGLFCHIALNETSWSYKSASSLAHSLVHPYSWGLRVFEMIFSSRQRRCTLGNTIMLYLYNGNDMLLFTMRIMALSLKSPRQRI